MLRAENRPRRSGSRQPSRPRIRDKVSSEFESCVIADFCETLGSPRALTVWMLYKYGEHGQLVELRLDPLLYEDVESFRIDYCATKLFSKCAGLSTSIDTKRVALSAAEAAEEQCRETNARIKSWRCGSGEPPLVASSFLKAKRKIASTLGPAPTLSSILEGDVGWSRGRTSSAFGTDLSTTRKYGSRPDVTRRASFHAVSMLASRPLWGAAAISADGPVSVLERGLNIVPGNTQIVVPKNAKTDRVICFEPHLNIRMQLAIGQFIRRRLRYIGVNLDDQNINRRRAKLASVTGHLATIDLASASDTISLELVYELLPVDWALLLDETRSSHTQTEGGLIRRNAKFSSMGNGFTFELESLIFYALASAITSDVSVYGDDIILPTDSVSQVIELFELAGFTVNRGKSFFVGHFRESCGMDAFRGADCTPVYLRQRIKTFEDAVKFHNSVYSWLFRWDPHPREWLNLLRKWRLLIPIPHGPMGYGDGHLHSCFDEVCPSRAFRGYEGWWYTTYARAYRDDWFGPTRGDVPERLAFASLCAVTGPRRVSDIKGTEKDRRQYKSFRLRAVASNWPSIRWID